jgi:quercetin dioxygenase-like cupin family protein
MIRGQGGRLMRNLSVSVVAMVILASGYALGQRQPPTQNSGFREELVTYLLEGQVTYRQEGKPDQVLRAGEGMAKGRGPKHWAENTGKVPAVWIGIDIPKQ